jgi:hypothetical protein
MAPESVNGHTTLKWMPLTAEDRQAVLGELGDIVSSYHFRGSKRYPALLQYVVDAALDNRLGDLKERTLGVEVFGRDPGYDTNADPVVRVSAGEVRKRIAQYYHENGSHSRVQIDLPLGSYAPEFLQRAPHAMEAFGNAARERRVTELNVRRRAPLRAILLCLSIVLLIAAGTTAYFYRQASHSGRAVTEAFWSPLVNAQRPVLIVLGTTHPRNMRPPTEETTFLDHITNPYHHVSVPTAIALVHLSEILEMLKKGYEVKEAPETTLTDIRSRPIVLVGALNNDWTMRLVGPLRFHFADDVVINGSQRIDDAAKPGPTGWSVNSLRPYLSITTDYAIVARFHDSTTEGPVVVIGGLGPYGTEAASEYVQSPRHLAELTGKLPHGWESKNLELVIKTDVIGGKAGPPVLLSTYCW